LKAENAALRHQLIVLQRKRARSRATHKWGIACFYQLYRWFPSVLKAITIIRPETLVRWHRPSFAGTGVGKAQNDMRPFLKFKIVDPRRGRSLIAQWRQNL
jgi:hypothetical protein